jgi:hypothetical protein
MNYCENGGTIVSIIYNKKKFAEIMENLLRISINAMGGVLDRNRTQPSLGHTQKMFTFIFNF